VIPNYLYLKEVGFMDIMKVIKYIAVALIIAGALNWGLVGAFHFNAVGFLLGDASMAARVVYCLIGLAGLYKIFLIVKK